MGTWSAGALAAGPRLGDEAMCGRRRDGDGRARGARGEDARHAALGRREIARRLRTSVPQLYRLLDTTNKRKSIKQLVSLLHVLDCDVELVVKDKLAAQGARSAMGTAT